MTLWEPSLTIAGVNVDENILDLITIRYGRRNSRSQVDATTCAIGLVWKSFGPAYNPDLLRLGAEVKVTATLPGPFGPTTVTRFSGAISDVTLGKNTAEIVATTNLLSTLGRTVIDAPALTGKIPTAATTLFNAITAQHPDLSFTLSTPTPSNADLDVDIAPESNTRALDALRNLIGNDPAGFIYENLTGTGLVVSTGPTRLPSEIVTTLNLAADQILDRFRLERSVASRINESTVTWTGGTVTANNAASIRRFGPYARRTETKIDNQNQAQDVALRIVSAGSTDSWNLESIPIELLQVAPTVSLGLFLNDLTINRLIQIPALIDEISQFPPRVFLEGWDETISRNRWTMNLHITDPRSVGWPQRWFEVPGSTTWNNLGPTWEQVAERWNETPNYFAWVDYSPTWEALLTEWITA